MTKSALPTLTHPMTLEVTSMGSRGVCIGGSTMMILLPIVIAISLTNLFLTDIQLVKERFKEYEVSEFELTIQCVS